MHKNPTLEFQSKEVKRFLIEFMPEASDINKDIQVKFARNYSIIIALTDLFCRLDQLIY